MKKQPRYATEADLCAAFIEWVKSEAGKFYYGIKTPVWTPYAETAGWDILLVAEDGTQIGVQAKLKFNMKVLQQAVPDSWDSWQERGPDYRAILVPEIDHGARNLASALGLMLFFPGQYSYSGNDFSPGLNMEMMGGWHYWSPAKRCELPAYVPDVPAGASGPVQLTKWKCAALRVVAVLELQGYVTRQDFRQIGIDSRRWLSTDGWLVPGAVPGQYVRGPGLRIDAQHPEVYAQVLADARADFEQQCRVLQVPQRELLA